ncbi:Protein kinase [uncultured virus]|nr:Protein kinase [uncultured virus]
MYITQYIKAKNLVKAIKLDIDAMGGIQLIQPLAMGDAADLVRHKKQVPSPALLKKWSWELVCAVAHLHGKAILHADIKAANALIFNEKGTAKTGIGLSAGLPRGNLVPAQQTAEVKVTLEKVRPGARTEPVSLEGTTVKLADYSLSVLLMSNEASTHDTNGKLSYTATHRAPEVWAGDTFSYAADIWALGCTLYELGYQTLLFPDQKGASNPKVAHLKAIDDWKQRKITPASILSGTSIHPGSPGRNKRAFSVGHAEHLLNRSALSDILPLPIEPLQGLVILKRSIPVIPTRKQAFPELFSTGSPPNRCPLVLTGSPPTMRTGIEMKQRPLPSSDYKTLNLDFRWERPEMHEFNSMLLKLLAINPAVRPSIWELITHPYFDAVRQLEDLPSIREFPSVSYPYSDLPVEVVNKCRLLTTDLYVVELALSLYRRTNMGQAPSLQTCVVMAHKLLYKSPPTGTPKVTWSAVQDEIALCLQLGYQLLAH